MRNSKSLSSVQLKKKTVTEETNAAQFKFMNQVYRFYLIIYSFKKKALNIYKKINFDCNVYVKENYLKTLMAEKQK